MTEIPTETLVTVFGGSGFLGRHVVRALAREGYRIRPAVRRPDLAGHLQPLGRVGQIHSVLVAFLPAAVIGALLHGFIKGVLFNVWIVCISLIIGGAVLLWIDRLKFTPRYHDATRFPLMSYLIIGFCQCLAMIPGVSRSGATIVGAMLLGADRRSAAEFSFYLAMPTMAGAFAYELYKSWGTISNASPFIVAVGFVVSFISAWIVVKTFLDYVSSHGFSLFGWWRIIVGAVGLVALGLFR